jgi:hypothetical protein
LGGIQQDQGGFNSGDAQLDILKRYREWSLAVVRRAKPQRQDPFLIRSIR